jgi:ABC-type proline/glycine betaine transport system permease subunit
MRGANAVEKGQQGFSMNHSIYSADRTTHLKIVVIALVAAIVGVSLGLSARSNSDAGSQTAGIIKAGKAIVTTSSDALVIR